MLWRDIGALTEAMLNPRHFVYERTTSVSIVSVYTKDAASTLCESCYLRISTTMPP